MIADNKIFSLGIENLETLNSFWRTCRAIWIFPDLMKKY